MQQKVWILGDAELKGAVQKSQQHNSSPAGPSAEDRAQSPSSLKNPALAFSLSLLVWGGGQMYLGEKRRGMIYLTSMTAFYLCIAGFVLFGDSLGRATGHHNMRPSLLLFAATVFFLAGLVVWVVNAVAAYFQALRTRSETFLGTENGYLSLFCSLLLPGWGQFLNGQPFKGLLFLPFAVAGLFSLFVFGVVQSGWPLLEADPVRRIFGLYLGASLLMSPFYGVLWIAAAYDSLRSCKVLFRRKLTFRNTGYRPAEHIRVRDLFPRMTAVLSLLLALSLGMQFLPKDYYKISLEKLRVEMLSNHVEIIPGLIHQVAGAIDHLK